MRTYGVVVQAPGLDDDGGLSAAAKPLQVQAFIAQFAVEGLLVPFCQGLPGSMCAVPMLLCSSQLRTAWLTNSGPLSDLRKAGGPWIVISLAKTSMTRADRMVLATSIAKASWVYSSTTVKHLICCPLAQASKTKS